MWRLAVLLVAARAAAESNESKYPEADAYTFYKLSAAAYCDVDDWKCPPCIASNQTVTSMLLLCATSPPHRSQLSMHAPHRTLCRARSPCRMPHSLRPSSPAATFCGAGRYNRTTDTRVFVASYKDKNTGHDNIVVSFRGTETLLNWIENLNIAKTDEDMSCPGAPPPPVVSRVRGSGS
jgi:hypothetical protein